MVEGLNLMAAKVCDSCKSATATVFCRADSAYLCIGCDCKIHAANKLASRHARVWVCEVCEHAPASVTCKADAAHLCSSCDRDIHSANPLARRHERVPLTPFFDSSSSEEHSNADAEAEAEAEAEAAAKSKSAAISKLFGDDYYSDAEEASWLLHNPNPNPNSKDQHNPNNKVSPMEYLLSGGGADDADDIDPYLDLDFGADPKPDPSSDVDGVVPDTDQKQHQHQHQHQPLLYSMPPAAASQSHYHFDTFHHAAKPYSLSYNQPSLSHSVSSSSLEYGVVPDAAISSGMGEGAPTTVTVTVGGHQQQQQQQQQEQMKVLGGGGGGILAMDREARVLRYKEKRKNRKFEKTIRYASRKAYAETRPRIKGRFAKRTDLDRDPGYGVVPSF